MTAALLLCSLGSYAQDNDTTADAAITQNHSRVHHYGRFNYKYLRIALPTPGNDFNNPVGAVPDASGHFASAGQLKNSYTLGFEGGSVRHFMGLDLGTPMLKLGINSGWTFQMFGKADDSGADYTVHTDGAYIIRVGLGPQLTFKPDADFRIGVYYRFGIALAIASYKNTEITQDRNGARMDAINSYLSNTAYNGDLGLDLAWRKLCLGFALSMLKMQPSKGHLLPAAVNIITPDTENEYTYQSSGQPDATVVPTDPVIRLNRFVVSLGLAF